LKTNHDFYIEALAKGLCGTCHREPHRPNKTNCVSCANRVSGYYQNRREKIKRLGICPTCKERYPKTGAVHCEICAEANKIKLTERYHNRKSANICTRCAHNPPESGKTLCSSCLSEYREIFASKLPYRVAVLERDDFKCQICGRNNKLHVHHIDGKGETTGNPNNDMDNLITLCTGCHVSLTKFRAPYRDKELIIRLILA
jgi:5-methylcytosine-specific restriction endonuclease McrA